MGQNPNGIRSRREWERAAAIFDEAYDRARRRWSSSSFWTAVWNDNSTQGRQARARLIELHNSNVIRLEFDNAGNPRGTPRVAEWNRQTGRRPWVPINIDHGVPLERNPWGVLQGDNLYDTNARYNQRTLRDISGATPFPMSVDRTGQGMRNIENRIEEFVLENSLSRQRRATVAELDARYGPRVRGRRAGNGTDGSRRRRRARTRIPRVPYLDVVIEMIMGGGRQSGYRHAVREFRAIDRNPNARVREYHFREFSATPDNVLRVFEVVVGDHDPLRVHQVGELRAGVERWMNDWDRDNGEGSRHNRELDDANSSATSRQAREILGMEYVRLLAREENLEELMERIESRLGERDYEEIAADALEAADAFDDLMESEIQSWAIEVEDAEYLSRRTFRRIYNSYNNFHTQLIRLRGLAFAGRQRYQRMLSELAERIDTDDPRRLGGSSP